MSTITLWRRRGSAPTFVRLLVWAFRL